MSNTVTAMVLAPRTIVQASYSTAPNPERVLAEFAAYLSSRQRAATTIHVYVYQVRRLMRVCPDLFSATGSTLERHIIALSSDWSARTQNSFISAVRSFYRWALRFEYITADPTKYLENVRVIDSMAPIADDNELLAALADCTPIDRALILLGRTAGLRRSEIASLHTSARDGDWLTVTGKGGRVRRLLMQQELIEALDALETVNGRGGYYFPGRFGGHRSPESIYAIIRRTVHTNPHSLRHAAATAVYEGTGHDIRAAQVFLGHKSIETTQRYVHVSEAQLELASKAARLTTRHTEES